jgi:hypothetical protein
MSSGNWRKVLCNAVFEEVEPMERELELERKERLLQQELETLGAEVEDLKRTHRAELDLMRLEMRSLELFLATIHPDFDERFHAYRERVRTQISPE